MLVQLYSACWGPSSACGQTGPGQKSGCWTEKRKLSIIHCSRSDSSILISTEYPKTYKANSSRSRLLYCFFGFIVLKKGSFITSGQTAGQGLPHIRLNDNKRLVETKRRNDKKIANKNTFVFSFEKKLFTVSLC